MNVTTQSWLKKLPSPLYKLAAQAWIDKTYPRHLFIETTSACNLSCAYCPREAARDHMDFELFRAIIREASVYGPRSFSLHLFGEPTLYPRWVEAVSFIKRQNRLHTVLLTTNGTTLNARVDALIAANPDQVFWTWRPEAQFTAATKRKLRRWGKFRVRFIQEITPKEAYEEWKDWKNVEGRKLHSYGGNIDLSKWSPSTTATNGPAYACYHLWLAPAVAWNGNILLCCSDPHQEEVVGTFPAMSVHEAWTSQKLKAIRESHLRGEFSGICKNCTIPQQYPNMFFSWQQHRT